MRIDAHQHFWRFDPVRDSWIRDDMSIIKRDFLPGDLQPLLEQAGINGCIAVQADQSEDETDFLVELANANTFIKGVVGWVDLQSENVEERLAHFHQFQIIKGFRHVLQGESRRDLMLTPAFINGIAALQEFGFTYDLLIFPDQLNFCKKLVARLPEQKFVLDHLGKPYINKGEIKEWKEDMAAMAKHPNVYCKLSGMVTEADWRAWKMEDIKPYLDVVTNAFGTDKIMFGSDWPVCLVAAEYSQTIEIINEYFSPFSSHEKQKIFGENAIRFYNL